MRTLALAALLASSCTDVVELRPRPDAAPVVSDARPRDARLDPDAPAPDGAPPDDAGVAD